MTLRPLRALALAALSLVLACGADAPDADAPGASPPSAPGPRAMVVHDGSGPRVLLRSGVEAEIAHGAPQFFSLFSVGQPVVFERAIHREGLTAAETRWEGRVVDLYGPGGRVCTGRVDEVIALGRFYPDDETSMRWHGSEGEEGEPGLPYDEIEKEATERVTSLGSFDLAAEIGVVHGDCEGALWAQLADERETPTGQAEPASVELTQRALDAIRAMPEYSEIQQTYEAYQAERRESGDDQAFPPRWEDYLGSPSVTLLAHPGGEQLVHAMLDVDGGCGDFNGSLAVVWRLDGDGLVRVGASGLPFGQIPTGLADVDGDGSVDLLLPDGFIKRGEAGFDEVESTSLPDNIGCRC